MNREILFRGKRVDNGEWVEGNLTINEAAKAHRIVVGFGLTGDMEGECHVCFGEFHLVDPSTIGQFTGLTDKNGVKIWEGDILHFQTYEGGGFGKVGLDAYSVVCYGKHNLSGNHTLGRTIGFYLDRNYDSDVSIYYWLESHKATVVGNRFDNPELTQQS